MRAGVRIGVDVGSVRIGVARSDASGLMAFPVETVPRGEGDLARIAALVVEHDALEVIVGLPLALDGSTGRAAREVLEFARRLSAGVAPVPVRMVDERLTTVVATRQLRAAGRTGRTSRKVVDQAAAVEIVQYSVDSERATGRAAGYLVRE